MLPRNYLSDQDPRRHQIDTLKIFNDHVTELHENKEYRVEFQAGDKQMSLNIILSSKFPNEKPHIFITPVVSHPWLGENSNEIVNAPGLVNYSVHADLGRIVQAIVREFQKSVPTMSQQLSKITLNETMDTSTNTSPQQSQDEVPMFPELNEMSVEELREILANTDLQDKVIENSPQMLNIVTEKANLMSEIEELCKYNIEKGQEIDKLKRQIVDKITILTPQLLSLNSKKIKYMELCDLYSPSHIMEVINKAVSETDDESEEIAKQFLNGNMAIDTFVNKYTEIRTKSLVRKACEERLAHQMKDLNI